MRSPAGRIFSLVASLISLVAVAWWVSHQGAPELPSSAAGLAWLGAALLVFALAMAARGWRWHRIMAVAELPHRRVDAFRLVLVGYMGNNVLPARGGELLRVGLLGARTPARKREILGSILGERVLDVGVLAALFAALAWTGLADSPAGPWAAPLTAAALVLAGTALTVYWLLRRRGYFEAFAARIRPVARGSRIFFHKEGVPLAIVSIAIWTLEGVTFLLIGRSLGLSVPFADAISAIVLASLFAAIPAAPGYAGTYDAGLVLGLTAAGIKGGTAVGYVLLARFVMFVPVTIAGLIVLFTAYGGLAVLRRRPEADEPPEPAAPPAPPGAARQQGPVRSL